MNFTSLRPYLQRGSPVEPAAAEPALLTPDLTSGWRTLAMSVLASLKENVLSAAEDLPFRERFEAVPIPVEEIVGQPVASGVAAQYDAALRDYRTCLETRHKEREDATQSLFALIKESLLTLSSGSTRATGTFSRLETSLKKASEARTIVELKHQVGDMLQFVQKEAEREARDHERALGSLNQRYAAVKHTTPVGLSKMPGRQDAIEAAREAPQGANLWTVLVVVEQSDAIRSRYGDPAIAELLQEVSGIRDKILATRVKAFRWSSNSLIFLVETYRDLTGFREDMKACLQSGFEFKLFVGSRLATLNVRLRWELLSPRDPKFAVSADRFVSEPV